MSDRITMETYKALSRSRRPAPRRARGVSESTLVTAILKTLQLKGVWAWRANAGARRDSYKGKEYLIKLGEAGTPDVMLVLPVRQLFAGTDTVRTIPAHAMLCGIEVKTATGKLRASQIAWHTKAERHGVRVGVARSVSDALELVKKWSGR